MSEFVVASRYAKSLIDLAKEKSLLDVVNNDMELFLQVCKTSRDFDLLLKSPIISNSKKSDVLKAIFESKVNTFTFSLFELAIKKGRVSILDSVASEFIRQYNVIKGIEFATVTTATSISKEVEAVFVSIIEGITATKIKLITKVDPALIGGFIIKVSNKQIDQSVASKLNSLRLEFSKNPYQKSY